VDLRRRGPSHGLPDGRGPTPAAIPAGEVSPGGVGAEAPGGVGAPAKPRRAEHPRCTRAWPPTARVAWARPSGCAGTRPQSQRVASRRSRRAVRQRRGLASSPSTRRSGYSPDGNGAQPRRVLQRVDPGYRAATVPSTAMNSDRGLQKNFEATDEVHDDAGVGEADKPEGLVEAEADEGVPRHGIAERGVAEAAAQHVKSGDGVHAHHGGAVHGL
jgi:hypothetical protein